jgi:hypothetical protein
MLRKIPFLYDYILLSTLVYWRSDDCFFSALSGELILSFCCCCCLLLLCWLWFGGCVVGGLNGMIVNTVVGQF